MVYQRPQTIKSEGSIRIQIGGRNEKPPHEGRLLNDFDALYEALERLGIVLGKR